MDRRRFVKIALTGATVLVGGGMLAGCTSPSEPAPPAGEPSREPDTGNSGASSTTLVVYYSHPETTATTDPANLTEVEENSAVVIDGEVLGNTQCVAQVVARATGADTYRIEAAHCSASAHDELTAQAQRELDEGFRPELASILPDMAAYGTVLLGYPIWWSSLPPAVSAFLEQADLAGKEVYLFNTHGGSGDAGTPAAVKALQDGVNVSDDNLVLSRDVVADSEGGITDWIERLGLSAQA